MMSLVALFECRSICPIEVGFYPASGVTRVELFDDSVYVSWFKSSGAKRIYFPETHKFPKESYMWEYQRLELRRRMDVAQLRAEFRSGQPEAELLEILGRVCGRAVTQAEVDGWKVSYKQSLAEFTGKLNEFCR